LVAIVVLAAFFAMFALIAFVSRGSNESEQPRVSQYPQFATYKDITWGLERAGYTVISEADMYGGTSCRITQGPLTLAEIWFTPNAAGPAGGSFSLSTVASMKADVFLGMIDEIKDQDMRSILKEQGYNALICRSNDGFITACMSGNTKDINEVLPEWLVIAGLVRDVLK